MSCCYFERFRSQVRAFASPSACFRTISMSVAATRILPAFRGRARSGASLADTVRLPVKPVWDVVYEMVDRTMEAWKTLGVKHVLSADILKRIDAQIEKVAANTTN